MTSDTRQSAKLTQKIQSTSHPTLGSVEPTECISNFDLEHLTKCLALAVQNEIILSISGARPYSFDQIVHQMLPPPSGGEDKSELLEEGGSHCSGGGRQKRALRRQSKGGKMGS